MIFFLLFLSKLILLVVRIFSEIWTFETQDFHKETRTWLSRLKYNAFIIWNVILPLIYYRLLNTLFHLFVQLNNQFDYTNNFGSKPHRFPSFFTRLFSKAETMKVIPHFWLETYYNSITKFFGITRWFHYWFCCKVFLEWG